MAGPDRLRMACAAVALMLGCLSPAAAPRAAGDMPDAVMRAFWLPDSDGVLVLNLPIAWQAGDAAVVVTPSADWPEGLREALIDTLVATGAAVLELPEPRSEVPRGPALRDALRQAVAALRGAEGAGLVVAIGMGEGGEAALAVAAEPTERADAYAGAVRLGPGPAGFATRRMDPAEAWPERAPMLCALLAAAQPGLATGFATACAIGLATPR